MTQELTDEQSKSGDEPENTETDDLNNANTGFISEQRPRTQVGYLHTSRSMLVMNPRPLTEQGWQNKYYADLEPLFPSDIDNPAPAETAGSDQPGPSPTGKGMGPLRGKKPPRSTVILSSSPPSSEESKMSGKNKSREKPSSIALGKSKYLGAVTRRQSRKMREDEENLKRGLKKLNATGKRVVDRSLDPNETLNLTDDGIADPVFEDFFSSNDLIRNNISDPTTFEPPKSTPVNDPIEIVTVQNIPTSKQDSVVDRIFSFNPLSFLQRTDPEEHRDEILNPTGENTDNLMSEESDVSIEDRCTDSSKK